MKKTIKLGTINDVKNFVTAAMRVACDIDLIHGKYAIDGKSIMGIFSLDLSDTLSMEIGCETETEDVKEFLENIKDYIVE